MRSVSAVHGAVRRRLAAPLPRAEVAASAQLGAHYAKLVGIVEGTVVKGENNSALLLGPRGSGKSATLEAALADVRARFADSICVVRLSGTVCVDDRHAVQAIARQICARQSLDFSRAASYGENLAFLPAALEDCAAAHRGVVFVLDELDVFCARNKQTLLYNLLDMLQSSRAQACVVGVSVRIDVADMMEKRVRSRFSHRRMLFAAPAAADAPDLVRAALTLPDADVESLERMGIEGASACASARERARARVPASTLTSPRARARQPPFPPHPIRTHTHKHTNTPTNTHRARFRRRRRARARAQRVRGGGDGRARGGRRGGRTRERGRVAALAAPAGARRARVGGPLGRGGADRRLRERRVPAAG